VRRGGDAAHTVRGFCSRIGRGSTGTRAGTGPPQEHVKPAPIRTSLRSVLTAREKRFRRQVADRLTHLTDPTHLT